MMRFQTLGLPCNVAAPQKTDMHLFYAYKVLSAYAPKGKRLAEK